MTQRGLGLLLVAVGLAGIGRGFGAPGAVPAAIWVAAALTLVGLLWIRPAGRPGTGQRVLASLLLGVAAMAGAGPLEGVVPAGVVAAAFLAVWLRDRASWALLPGGLLGSTVLTALAAALAPAWNPAPILFLGFAAIFSLLYLLPREAGGGRRWALPPALFFAVMTVVVNDPQRGLPGWLIPTLLILGGVTMLAGVRRR